MIWLYTAWGYEVIQCFSMEKIKSIITHSLSGTSLPNENGPLGACVNEIVFPVHQGQEVKLTSLPVDVGVIAFINRKKHPLEKNLTMDRL